VVALLATPPHREIGAGRAKHCQKAIVARTENGDAMSLLYPQLFDQGPVGEIPLRHRAVIVALPLRSRRSVIS